MNYARDLMVFWLQGDVFQMNEIEMHSLGLEKLSIKIAELNRAYIELKDSQLRFQQEVFVWIQSINERLEQLE